MQRGQLMNELQRLKVIIEADISALKQQLNEAQKTVENFSKVTERAGQAVNQSLNGNISTTAIKQALSSEEKAVKNLQKEIELTTKRLEALQSRMRELTEQEAFYKNWDTAYQGIIDQEANVSDAIDFTRRELAKLNEEQEVRNQKIRDLNAQLEEAKTKTQQVTDEHKKLNKETDKTAKSSRSLFGGGWGGLIKRLVVIRLLRTIIYSILASIKESVQYLAQYDKKLGGIAGYNKALSQMATSWDKLKVTIGVTAAELLTTLAPVISGLTDVVRVIFEQLNGAIAALQGKDTYTVANPEYWKDYADYVAESNGKLKETKTLISGFDELNTLNKSQTLFSSDNPLTIEKEVTAVNHLVAALGIAGLLSLLPKIIDLFKKKNKALKDQTLKTKLETAALKILNKILGGTAANASSAVAAFDDLSYAFETLPAIEIDSKPAVEAIDTVRMSMANLNGVMANPLIEVTSNTAETETEVKTGVQNIVGTVKTGTSDIETAVRTAGIKVNAIINTYCTSALNRIKSYVTQAINEINRVTIAMENQGSSGLVKAQRTKATTTTTTTTVKQRTGNVTGTTAGIEAAKKQATTTTNPMEIPRNNGGYGTQGNGVKLTKAQANALSMNILSMAGMTLGGVSTVAGLLKASTSALTAAKFTNATAIANQIVEDVINTVPAGSKVTSAAYKEALEIIEDLIPHLAKGGVFSNKTIAMVGEYQGASSNPEIVTPENKMREVVSSANNDLASVYIQVGRQIIAAIENKDLNFSISDEQIGYAAARANNSYYHRTGRALI